MPLRHAVVFIPILSAAVLLPARGEDFSAEQVQFFESNVRPVLAGHCVKCHGPEKQNNGLRLDSRAGVLKGSDYGPVAEAGKPEGAKILRAIRHESGVEAMPKGGAKLSDSQIGDLAEWIRLGLPWPADAAAPPAESWRRHWAFQPVRAPAVPDEAALRSLAGSREITAWLSTPLDKLILFNLLGAGLTPSPPASRAVLIRRAYIDLLGFPPDFAAVQAFEGDGAPEAWPRLLDRLLASPHYGERRARHWMDTARYADTKGYVFQEERRYAYAYTYRDWLIRAFNRDLPYDQFLIKQIAADKTTDWQKEPEDLAAMGFLTLGRRFLNNMPDIIDDRLDVVFRGTQALTLGCARCHDHKFDPIPTADYYSLYGVFANSREPDDKPQLSAIPEGPEAADYHKGAAERLEKVEAFRREKMAELFKPEVMERYRAAAPEAAKLDDGDRQRRDFARDKNLNRAALNRWIEWLAGEGKSPGANIAESPAGLKSLTADEVERGFTRADREALAALRKELEKFKATHPASPPRAMIMVDNETVNEPVVFVRGDSRRRGPQVKRRWLQCLSPATERHEFKEGSGRLELARHLASPDNPLTARVFVNRVWGQLFDRPLVETPGDFGVRTPPPVQPEVLDQLAAGFVQNGWSVKRLMRDIMLSAAYQQSSAEDPVRSAIDPENLRHWRQNRKRLDYEALRDSLLKVSGTLDPAMFGRPVELLREPFSGRRTIYGFIDRQNLPNTLRTFDFASPDNSAPRRYETTVPQQALYMMNSPFVIAQAKRMIADGPAGEEKNPDGRIRRLFFRVLQREPSAEELALHRTAVDALQAGPRQTATRWQNGFGYYEEAARRVHFTPLPHFKNERWSGSDQLPDPVLGWVVLDAMGGHPGDATHAAVRRWNAPNAVTVGITGEISVPDTNSRGARALVVHGKRGVLWQADVAGGAKASVTAANVQLEPDDALDFIVDCAGDTGNDSFQWSPVIRDVRGGEVLASAAGEFGGPGTTAWEAWAQVLLCTNEFLFVD